MRSEVLETLAIVALVVAVACAIAILVDVLVLGYRQPMPIMAVVWPVSALYLGPVAVWAYLRWGRPRTDQWQERHGSPASSSFAASVAIADSHCGAGCTLGDIIGASLVFLVGLQIAGKSLWADLIIDFTLAFTLGIVFQYLTIAPMRELDRADGLKAAIRADTLSLVAFEIGLFGWMILLQLVFFSQRPLDPDEPSYWFMMQIGMILGFLTAYPANWWLVRRGYKERM